MLLFCDFHSSVNPENKTRHGFHKNIGQHSFFQKCASDLFVGESSYAARLIFQAGLASLLHVSHVPQIPHEHTAARRSHDQPISGHGQRVDLKHSQASDAAPFIRSFIHSLTRPSRLLTFSGCVKVPALQGVLGSQSLTDISQLPVTITLTSGQYSTQRMGASCVPTIVSEEEQRYGQTSAVLSFTSASCLNSP